MDNSNQQGIILISALMLLSVLVLFTLTQMQLVWLHYRASNRLITKQHLLRKLEVEANKILALGPEYWHSVCIVPADNPNHIPQILGKEQACRRDNEYQFVFLVEDLGNEPCLQTVIENQPYSTQHWRLTIATQKKPKEYLQIHFAKAAPILPCISSLKHSIPQGILSWRYFMEK